MDNPRRQSLQGLHPASARRRAGEPWNLRTVALHEWIRVMSLKFLGGTLLCGIAMLCLASTGRAQDVASPLPSDGAASSNKAELRARLERLEQQNQELMRALQDTSAPAAGAEAAPPAKEEVQKIVADYLKDREDKKKGEECAAKAKLEDEGYRVGSNLSVEASWKTNGTLWLSTPNKDFTMHPGFWCDWDNVFWNQTGLLRTPPDGRPGAKQEVASGASKGGIGNLQDGEFFRRIRPYIEGTLWENIDYRLILALENNQFQTSGLNEFWVGVNYIPVVGTIRFGHVRTPMGFEADMASGSRAMTFLERSAYADAIELNQNFVTGVWQNKSFLDEHATITTAAFRQDLTSSTGASFGDGQWGAQGRITALPIYECEGRTWLHLGLSGGWRNGTANDTTSSYRTFQLRARPEMRDDVQAGGFPNGNSNRLIDTGVMAGQDQWISGLEFCHVRGPFSLQAEWGWNWVDDVTGFAPNGFTLNPRLKTPQDYVFSGGYIQLAYMLTGEARGYNRKLGTLPSDYFGGNGPFTNAWLTRGENGRLNAGWGAWEIAARYSYVNLNDGSGLNRIQGGVMNGLDLGLNWYLNANVKFNFDWVYDQRSAVPIGTYPGYTQGFGSRVQISF
jgi:phosphate-selective porin OprO/OprP